MKYTAAALLGLASVGCTHHGSFTLEPAPFIETQTIAVSVNLRDDRLLHSDVLVRGQATQFVTASRTQAQPFWEFQLEIESSTGLDDVRIVLQQASQGDPSYVSAELWRGSVLRGNVRLPRFEVATNQRRAFVSLQFLQRPGDESTLRGRTVDLGELVNRQPNQALQTTPVARGEI